MPISLKVLFEFGGAVGITPFGGLILDANGNLFGEAEAGGANGVGTVFELPNTPAGYATTPVVLMDYSAAQVGGASPHTVLFQDSGGNLLGTTESGGAFGFGTVFEIPKTATGFGAPVDLTDFNAVDGASPASALIADSAGNLFGTTQFGGLPAEAGTVFELAKTATGYASTPIVLVTFDITDGFQPSSPLLMDSAGNLFGTTLKFGLGGTSNGLIYEIQKTAGGYATTPTDLAKFTSPGGVLPEGNIAMDANGDLFGTTEAGGASADGTIWELPNTAAGYATAPVFLADFNGLDGQQPSGGVIIDAAGNLFGMAQGGTVGFGVVFELAKSGTGYASAPTDLVSFTLTTGSTPVGPLVADASGNLFGTASAGGSAGAQGTGTVFEVTGTGFQVACYRSGTRIATPAGERVVESLALGDLVLTMSGEARPVVWIGHRHVACRRHPMPENVWPVRVLAAAFGDAMPRRDLWLSPDHAVFIDDVLIPVKHLINGTTIAQVPVDDVTYYHIKLDRHDVLLAEGLPAESWLDTGDRDSFANGGGAMRLFPDFSSRAPDICALWEAYGCAPLVLTGPKLEAARRLVNSLVGGMSQIDPFAAWVA